MGPPIHWGMAHYLLDTHLEKCNVTSLRLLFTCPFLFLALHGNYGFHRFFSIFALEVGFIDFGVVNAICSYRRDHWTQADSLKQQQCLPMAETTSELQEGLLINHKESKTLVNYDDRDRSMSTKERGREPEVLHDGLSFRSFMAAGSVAGMVEHMAMFPVDTLKTRMQMLATSGGLAHSGVGRAIMSIVKSEGPLGLYRGIGAMGLGAGPAHAVYFSVYEVCKERLGGNRHGHHPVAHGASGILATIASDAVFTPMDVVKQRLQLRSSPYGGVWDCIKRMSKEEGFRSFYVSYRTTVVMNAPFTAVHFATYEAAKKILMGVSPENASEERLVVHVTAGGLAGALASAVTTPLDVVKTRLQCQGVCGADRFTSSSIADVVKKIITTEGYAALMRGLKPRMLFHAPAAAICWSTYEASKSLLQHLFVKQSALD